MELIERLRALRDVEEKTSLEELAQALGQGSEGQALSEPAQEGLGNPNLRRTYTYQAEQTVSRLQGQTAQELADKQEFLDFRQKVAIGRDLLERSLLGLQKDLPAPPAD